LLKVDGDDMKMCNGETKINQILIKGPKPYYLNSQVTKNKI